MYRVWINGRLGYAGENEVEGGTGRNQTLEMLKPSSLGGKRKFVLIIEFVSNLLLLCFG